MTAQIPDLVRYDDADYLLADRHGDGLFDPRELGIEPTSTSSANWRGFRCAYAVVDGALVLRELRLSLGVRERVRALKRTLPGLVGVTPTRRAFSEFTYEELSRPVEFSGALLLAGGFGASRENMGGHLVWGCREVRELFFAAGRLTRARDLSLQVATMRADYARRAHLPPGVGRSDDELWAGHPFSFEYGGLRPPSPGG